MRTLFRCAVVLLFATGVASGEAITVSAAISTKESLEQIATAYEAKTGDQVQFNFDASGKLAQQIAQGAPVDAFVSAGAREVDGLVKAGRADARTRRAVVANTLVLIVPADATDGPKSFADLAASTGKLAVGAPNSVPAGHYAEQVLSALRLTNAVAPRLVYGENVRQVLTYVRRGEVAAGIVYGTDAREAGDAVRVVATAATQTHEPIEYPAVVISGAAHPAAALRFLEYLTTEPAQGTFVAHGFTRIAAGGPTTRPTH